MTRAILHAPSGQVEYTLEVEPTTVGEYLVIQGKRYRYAGFQDGTAHYVAAWGEAE